MNVQLLLLLALAGPFCAFTHASPTALPPTDVPGTESAPDHGMITDITVHLSEDTTLSAADDSTVFTGPPATDPPAAPADVTEALTTAAPAHPETTEEPMVETVAPAAASTAPPAAPAAPESIITDAPSVETAAPAESAKPEVPSATTGAAQEGPGGEVVVEEEGLSSGQVVGIVIGALLAVVIVIAVVIAVVRRMGKYSSAKKKPTKKDVMVSPLRRKSAKQQERSKFWKF